jgi:hypothetical protein
MFTKFRYDGSYITDPQHSKVWKLLARHMEPSDAARALGCEEDDLPGYCNKMFTITQPDIAVYNYDGTFRLYVRIHDA